MLILFRFRGAAIKLNCEMDHIFKPQSYFERYKVLYTFVAVKINFRLDLNGVVFESFLELVIII